MTKLALPDFLDALSIDRATDSTWGQVIAAGYDTLEKIRTITPQQLAAITLAHGGRIGERATFIHASLHSPRVTALLDRAHVWLDTTVTAAHTGEVVSLKIDVSGKNVCMTGTGPADRKALAAQLKAAGANVQSAVSSTTHYLLCESADSQSSKAKSARKLGTTVLGYNDVF